MSVSSDASNRSPRGHLPQDQRQLYAERIEVTVQVGGKDVLLEEVETFTVAVPMPQAPPPS